MRVITGTARGRKLISPEGTDVRPTSDMVKEAMFSILQNDIPGGKVLDLFAGSGQLGIEALSRGAAYSVFIDSSRTSLDIIRKNLLTTDLEQNSRVAMMDAKVFLLSNKDLFDVVFIDPPYNQGIAAELLPLLEAHMTPMGVIICETDNKEVLPESVGEFTRKKEYRYGRIKLTTYRKEEE